MVKVVDRTPDEIAQRGRSNKLARIAEDTFRARVDGSLSHTIFRVCPFIHQDVDRDLGFDVYPTDQLIRVYSPEQLDSAVRLATRYEESGEPEFTVQREY